MCLCLTSRNGPPSQCYSATRSLKIRLPEFTLTAWVRDGRLDFHAKPAPNVGGQRAVVAAHADALFIKPLQYSGGYATADNGQVDAGCIRIENGELRMENGG